VGILQNAAIFAPGNQTRISHAAIISGDYSLCDKSISTLAALFNPGNDE
jgi:hypothetical protein